MSENKATETTANEQDGKTFAIQRIYLKDLSFEAPSTPAVFKQQWQPNMNLELHTTSEKIEDQLHEVVLSATVTVKSEENTAFLVEIKEAGIFTIDGFEEEQEKVLLGSVCPSILFPYLREIVTDVVNRASFPQLILAPVNFDALYAEHMKQQQETSSTEA